MHKKGASVAAACPFFMHRDSLKYVNENRRGVRKIASQTDPQQANVFVGWRGQGTPAPYQQYTRRHPPVQAALFDLPGEREGLRDEVCGCFKGEESCVDQQVIEFGLGTV